MAYGLIIRKDNGAVWIAPDVKVMNLIHRYQGWWQSGHAIGTNIPTGTPVMAFARFLDGSDQNSMFMQKFDNGGTVGYRFVGNTGSGRNMVIYIFAAMVNQSWGYGMRIFDAQGRETWNANMLPLEIHMMDISENTTHDMGTAVAAQLTLVRAIVQFDSQIGGYRNIMFAPWCMDNRIGIRVSNEIRGASGPGAQVATKTTCFIYAWQYD